MMVGANQASIMMAEANRYVPLRPGVWQRRNLPRAIRVQVAKTIPASCGSVPSRASLARAPTESARIIAATGRNLPMTQKSTQPQISQLKGCLSTDVDASKSLHDCRAICRNTTIEITRLKLRKEIIGSSPDGPRKRTRSLAQRKQAMSELRACFSIFGEIASSR